jgi:hypothetical protein
VSRSHKNYNEKHIGVCGKKFSNKWVQAKTSRKLRRAIKMSIEAMVDYEAEALPVVKELVDLWDKEPMAADFNDPGDRKCWRK